MNLDRVAIAIVASLAQRRLTVATAESLTGGLVCSTLVGVPGASAVVVGGVIAYATSTKATVLGVDVELLSRSGAVDPDVALGMAHGVRTLFAADIGVSTTGVAGPTAVDGHRVGLVYVAVSSAGHEEVSALHLSGGRSRIRKAAASAALELLARTGARAG